METNERNKEISAIILTIIIFSISVSLLNLSILPSAILSFTIIILSNIIVKKLFAHHFEIDIKTKFWSIYQIGLKKSSHLKKPLPSIILPLIFSIISSGYFLWLGVLEFDAKAKPERASRRHGLYRFTQITERHLGFIAFFGFLTNILFGILGYVAGFELFARLNIYFAMWSIIPISRLDGTKIAFASRALWIISFAISSILLILSFATI